MTRIRRLIHFSESCQLLYVFILGNCYTDCRISLSGVSDTQTRLKAKTPPLLRSSFQKQKHFVIEDSLQLTQAWLIKSKIIKHVGFTLVQQQ